MSKILLLLEVSRKQDYIFLSIHLRDNAARSDIIRYVTSEEFFKQAAPEYYNSRENFVYAGGGHTILQFGDRATATRFAEQVTQKAMREYDLSCLPSRGNIGRQTRTENRRHRVRIWFGCPKRSSRKSLCERRHSD